MPDGSLKKSGTESKEISGTLCCANNGSANNMTIETPRHNFIGGLPAEFSSTLGSNLFLESRKQPLCVFTLEHFQNITRDSQVRNLIHRAFRSVRLNSPYRKRYCVGGTRAVNAAHGICPSARSIARESTDPAHRLADLSRL